MRELTGRYNCEAKSNLRFISPKDGSQSSAIILTVPDFEDALRQAFGFEVDNVLRQLAEVTQPTDFVNISGKLVSRLNLQYDGCVSWGEDRDLEQKGTWLIRRRK